jgi:hypothetical protein
MAMACMWPEGFAEKLTGAIQPGHDGSDGTIEGVRNLFIAQPFHISQDHHDPKRFW